MENDTRLTNFIQKANLKHGDKYDYSKVEYVNNSTKVEIICPKHGSFWQAPRDHASGKGCTKCGIERKVANATLSSEEFLARARAKHGDKYDYSKGVYAGIHKLMTIICPIHGEFEQRPSVHLREGSHGCYKCGKANSGAILRDTTEGFIEKARAKHGDKYDYSKVVYVDSTTKVEIICPKHGSFWQVPGGHVRGSGCNECGYEEVSKATRSDTPTFIAKAKLVHGEGTYDYSKVDYKTSLQDVEIICPKHGSFWTTPGHFLQKHGCPKCAETAAYVHWSPGKPGYFYVIRCTSKVDDESFVKVGITSQRLRNRLADIAAVYSIEVVYRYIYMNPLEAAKVESIAKELFREYRYTPKQSFGGDSTECFSFIDMTKLDLPTYTYEYLETLVETLSKGEFVFKGIKMHFSSDVLLEVDRHLNGQFLRQELVTLDSLLSNVIV